MAILKLENGILYTDEQAISRELASLNIQLHHWTVGSDGSLRQLLNQDSLDDAEKEQVLTALDDYYKQLQDIAGYQSRDLIVLHPGLPDLETLLEKFDRIHTHADDEVRYIIDGEGVFGFVCPDGSQVELTVQAEEYINVPAGTEHWFYLTPHRRIKAIRYFTGTEGWVPNYTGTEIHSRQTTRV